MLRKILAILFTLWLAPVLAQQPPFRTVQSSQDPTGPLGLLTNLNGGNEIDLINAPTTSSQSFAFYQTVNNNNRQLLFTLGPAGANFFVPLSNVGSISAVSYGVKCDGSTDNTTALQNWLNALAPNTAGVLPYGVCNFSSGLTLAQTAVSIYGSGPYSTVLQYTGASTTADLLTIGPAAVNVYLSGFRIASTTTMTNGSGIHFKTTSRSQLENIVADGQDGNGKLWNGLWFDQVDLMRVTGFEARGQNDAIRVNGTVGAGPKADLILSQGKMASSGVGIHVGGAFGGLGVDQVDIIANNTNVKIDTALAAEGNRELFFGSTCFNDSAQTGDGININDTLASGGTIAVDGWVASAQAGNSGINIVSFFGGNISIAAKEIFNNTGDGIKVQDATVQVNVSSHTQIHGNGGWGINATSSALKIYASPQNAYANTSGSFSPNAHVGGVWTPTITFGGASTGITYTVQGGQYFTYGNIVTAYFSITLSSKGTSTGTALVGGLPLPVANTGSTPGSSGGAATAYGAFSGLTSPIIIEGAAGSSTINLYQVGATGVSAMQDTNFTNTTQFQGTLIYVR